ncbi:hypothetical protein SUGI_0900480 [Cryptomeria japonica]|nr:hypothetical protein SUGI_0900480 [Cryptomeria japonica]
MGALAAGSQCMGRCLYKHGVPRTGKTTTAITTMKKLWAKVDAKVIHPYRFVEINGLKLAQPENLYRTRKAACPPYILLIDELDLLVTRNQLV